MEKDTNKALLYGAIVLAALIALIAGIQFLF